jgi:hypothetical protein
MIWSKSRVFLQIRISELFFLGIKPKQKYFYKVTPDVEKKRLIIDLKKGR